MNIDLNDLRSAVTLLAFGAFIGVVAWAWRAQRRAAFDAAAQLPFCGDQAGDDDLTAKGARDE